MEIIYFYSSLRGTCVFDTSPLSAFDMRGYFPVFIKLTVNRCSILGYFTGSPCFFTAMSIWKIRWEAEQEQATHFTCDLF